MSLRRTFAITARLLAQFRHDPRTLAILFVTPLVLLTLFALLFRADVPDPRVGVLLEGSDAFATSLADSGATMVELQQLLGHRSLQTVQVYTSATDDAVRPRYAIAEPTTPSSLTSEATVVPE